MLTVSARIFDAFRPLFVHATLRVWADALQNRSAAAS